MKKVAVLFFLLSITVATYSQDDNLQIKLDSITKEADLLFSYEKVAWNATDIVMVNYKLKKDYGGYIVYHSNDTIFITFINKSQKERNAKYYFTSADLDIPFRSEIEVSPLTKIEQKLLDIKMKIINQFSDPRYEVGFPQDYNPNLVLFKEEHGYKLYIIMGTSKSGIIPFGNDYIFRTDLDGNITSWQKFHSRLIPTPSKAPNGEMVLSVVHSHLKTTPYITATDICTFRLYGPLCDISDFMVLCTATGKYYKYNITTNKITITEP